MTTFPALTHVALTVRDLSVSVPWYEALLDAAGPRRGHRSRLPPHRVPDRQHTARAAPAHHGAPPEPFSEFRVGLDHVAFGCADRAELEQWQRRSTSSESARRHQGPRYGSGISFRDPDGIALEFFAPPS